MTLILGSQSPRRREIMGYFSLPFQCASPDFDEASLPFDGDPIAYVKALAIGKADSLVKDYPDHWVLTADTIVYRDGKVYGKPQSLEDAFLCLKELAGHSHSVYTAVALAKGDERRAAVEESVVTFRSLTDQQIRNYHAALHCDDKAGAYAIQGAGGLIAERIEGCYYNVMGLPIQTVDRLLTDIGMSLWDHLSQS